ncbi:nuclear transport factor 2 family protein [Actinomadura sp. NAK00032]|uniref:nuclear transport factor 2 family protein n=1 Tax=Actinomadura sp. NAK00032 TaxID=2742128 RepID=UPI001592312F|nr:nuclear transport factor 2 family protein [Actinomadura sp. NAK00032]QKW38494.1 nuclear transport factor 2 family protein [Actinomadura sp. NAK00032]
MTPDDFPAVFAEGWALPKPDAFLDHFRPLIHGDAVFTQPMFPDAHGLAEVERMFRRLFALFPDMDLTVRTSAVQGGTVFIESDCTATLGRKAVRFGVCDRFAIADGTIRARASYSDPLPVLLTGLRRPSCWPRLLRSRTA